MNDIFCMTKNNLFRHFPVFVLLFWAFLFSGSHIQAEESVASADRPNIVIFYVDDMPKGRIGIYGGQDITPNIDRLAKEGVRFNRYSASAALCAPSRYSLQTGRYASTSPCQLRLYPAGGPVFTSQFVGDEEGRPPEQWNLPTVMKDAGYRTGFVGKYHLGFMGDRAKFGRQEGSLDDPEMLAELRHNFELAQEGAYAGGYDYAEALWHDNAQINNFPGVVRYHNPEWITWKAFEFMEQESEEPFFLVINHTLTHHPKPQESLAVDRSITPIGRVEFPEVQPSRASVLERASEGEYAGNDWAPGIVWFDDAVGAVLNKLEDMGLADDTIVFFLEDNAGKRSNHNNDAASMIRWPGVVTPDRASEALFQNVDIAPTVFEMVGIESPQLVDEMHGVSMVAHLVDPEMKPRQASYTEFGYQRAVVRNDGFKYIATRIPEGLEPDRRTKRQFEAPTDMLFNLNEDPHEKNNLADDPAYAETLEEMKALMAEKCAPLPHAFGEFTQGKPEPALD